MLDLNFNESNFSKLITNKKVIFVGPSRLLIDTQKGNWIDSFDVVIRTNASFPVQEKYQIDYGKKCDFLYVNVQFTREHFPLPVENYKENHLQFICFKAGIPDEPLASKYNDLISIRSYGKVGEKLKIKHIKGILTGSMILEDVLSFLPSELWVTGIDFYLHGQWNWGKAYIDNYLSDTIIQKAKKKKAEGKLIPHDIESNKEYMIDLYKREKIKFDDDVLKLLGNEFYKI